MSVTMILRKGPGRTSVRANLDTTLDRLSDQYDWQIDIKRYVQRRTDEQNNALFGVAYKALSEQMGFDKDELHEYFCGLYFGWKTKQKPGGRFEEVPIRTTTHDEFDKRNVLNAVEFAAFYDFIQRRAMQDGGYIVPDPDPFWRESRNAA